MEFVAPSVGKDKKPDEKINKRETGSVRTNKKTIKKNLFEWN